MFVGLLPTLTKSSHLYLRKRGRRVLSVEGSYVQGIGRANRDIGLSANRHGELNGNSFNLFSIQNWFIATMAAGLL